MNKKFRKTRWVAIVAMGFSFSVATFLSPRPAQADALTTAAIGGVVLWGFFLGSRSPSYVTDQNTSVTQSVIYPSPWATFFGSMDRAAIVYSSAPPRIMNQSQRSSTTLETQSQANPESTEQSSGMVVPTSSDPITPQAVVPMDGNTGPDRVLPFRQTS